MGSLCRLVIVDDNSDSADSLALLLRLEGYEALTVYDGLEAEAVISQTFPDLVLMDLSMPGVDGFEIVRSLRKQPWGKDLLILAYTGWANDRERVLEAGFDEQLIKPVEAEVLHKWLKRAANKNAG
jgi:CheY-like chemotaxis protein